MNGRVTGTPGRRDRAQSHTVGIILLTAVIVILMGMFGVFFLGSVNDRANGSGPLVDAEVNVTDERVSIIHGGGESVDADDLAITLRLDGESERYGFDDGIVTRSATDDDPEQFEPTERVEWSHELGAGEMRVIVIHEPSNGVLAREYLFVSS